MTGQADSASAEAATQAAVQHRLGDECGEDLPAGAECVGVPGAFCRPEDGRCACREGRVAAADDRDRCELPARLGEECHFDEQCGVATPRTVCVQGRCRCSEGLVAVNVSVEEAGGGGTGGGGDVGGEGGGDGGGGPHAACIEPGRRRLGEPCKDRKECGAPNSFCLPGKDVCACLPEFPLTDGHSQCGKPAAWNDSCDFSEQCLATTDKTVCRAGRCVCMYQMRAERQADGSTKCLGGELKYGDRCDDSSQCGFDHGVCEKQSGKQLCLCQPDYPVTNHINMCGKPAKINETCEFSEQCERTTEKTECRDGRCVCLFQMGALYKNDGSVECVDIKQEPPSLQYVDPTMIGVLVGLGLMFIILCVVLHLFSKARWRENRTIFNTPNPRLMNVSLLRDSKLIHGGDAARRRHSYLVASRQPSMSSLRPPSPTPSFGGGSRRGSKGSNVSATSTRSPRSPAKPPPSPLVSSAHPHSLAAVAATPATTGSAPTLESVTVEIRGSRATTPQQQQL